MSRARTASKASLRKLSTTSPTVRAVYVWRKKLNVQDSAPDIKMAPISQAVRCQIVTFKSVAFSSRSRLRAIRKGKAASITEFKTIMTAMIAMTERCGLKYPRMRARSWLSLYSRSYASASRPSMMKPIRISYSLVIVCKDSTIKITALHELIVRPLIDDLTMIEHEDAIGPADLRQAMGDEQGCTALQHPSDGALDLVFRRTVDSTG